MELLFPMPKYFTDVKLFERIVGQTSFTHVDNVFECFFIQWLFG